MSAGAKDWLRQRVLAVLLIPLSAWLLWAGVTLAGADHASAVAFFRQPLNSIAAVLLAVTALYHTQAGVMTMIEDYVPAGGLSRLLSVLTHVGCGAGVVVVIWVVANTHFGA